MAAPLKVAYVVPRYGTEIRGGAETGARMFAEHLVAERGYAVEVFTTCALDALTWRDEVASGTETVVDPRKAGTTTSSLAQTRLWVVTAHRSGSPNSPVNRSRVGSS